MQFNFDKCSGYVCQKAMIKIWLMTIVVFAEGVIHAQQKYQLHLASGSYTPSANVEAYCAAPTAVLASEIYQGKYSRILQFKQIPDGRVNKTLQSLGIELTDYIDFGGYLALIPAALPPSALGDLGLRSIVPIEPKWKVAPKLFEQPYATWAWDGKKLATIVSLRSDASLTDGMRALEAMGIQFRQTDPNPALIYAFVEPSNFLALAALPVVAYIELIAAPGEAEDLKGRALHRSNLVDSESASGPKFTGKGVGVLVRDDGAVGPHIDFQGRINNIATEFGPTHGDGVSGILAGAGNLDPDKRGMAAGAELYVIDYLNSFQDNTMSLHINNGVKITNSSYSDGCNAGYTAATVTVDQQIFENPSLMHVFSAGNSNSTDCDYGAGNQWGNITGGHKQAKNAIATANLNQNGVLEATSSRGPAYDGRLKPDISANGAGHLSTDEANTYLTFGGTSAAAPGIAGCMAQLYEAYQSFHNGQVPPSALIKAALLNTANDIGNVGPDYKHGWGQVNTARALHTLQNQQYATNQIMQGEQRVFDIQVPPGALNMRVMVYWPEKSASQMAAKALINDIDIQVNAPDLSVGQPWLLNPAANATTLNALATRGRDSLNNMEQVYFDAPVPGTYQLRINGNAIPFGAVEYFVVYDIQTEPIRLTFPNGGEGLSSSQPINIVWDAVPGTTPFAINYSIDAGATWQNLTNPGANVRLFSWTVPNSIASGKVLFEVVRGTQSDRSDALLSIMPLVTGLDLVKICPDSISVKWNSHATAQNYEVLLLGDKYMEVVGATTDTTLTIAKQVSFDPIWLSIRPILDGGAGRRINALQYAGGQLLNCPQPIDYAINTLLQPAGGGVFGCDPNSDKVKVAIQNQGTTAITNLSVVYQIDQSAPIVEVVPEILPGVTYEYVFVQPMVFAGNGNYVLKTWVNAPGDNVAFNDTITSKLVVITQAQTGYFTQDFETGFPPLGYRVLNPDGDLTWEYSANITGADNLPTRAAYLNHFDYETRGELDQLFVIPIDLSSVNKATLSFDLAHANYDNTYSDGLRIEVYRGCSLAGAPEQVYEQFSPELSTVPDQTPIFSPMDASEWRKESINLDQFLGDKIILAFTAINDFGNSTFIDNINLSNASIVPPNALIQLDKDTICRLDTIQFSTPELPSETYAWSFGSGALPSTVATGAGPHYRSFIPVGDKNVRLITTNQGGKDTAFQVVHVQPLPNFAFASSVTANTVTFLATTNTPTVFWEFGDGATSTQLNPIHTYAATGTYTVTMSVTNKCSTETKTETIVISTISTSEALESIGGLLVPNPNQGTWELQLTRASASNCTITLSSIEGKLLYETQIKHPGSNQNMIVPFRQTDLPAGIYLIEVNTETESAIGRVLIQK
jgi:PKD repeat protein